MDRIVAIEVDTLLVPLTGLATGRSTHLRISILCTLICIIVTVMPLLSL
jgi:hypothetical protein